VVAIEAYYPIAWGAAANYHAEGATTIIYDALGTDPEYYKGPYRLF
jgi:hypothetical protein